MIRNLNGIPGLFARVFARITGGGRGKSHCGGQLLGCRHMDEDTVCFFVNRESEWRGTHDLVRELEAAADEVRSEIESRERVLARLEDMVSSLKRRKNFELGLEDGEFWMLMERLAGHGSEAGKFRDGRIG